MNDGLERVRELEANAYSDWLKRQAREPNPRGECYHGHLHCTHRTDKLPADTACGDEQN